MTTPRTAQGDQHPPRIRPARGGETWTATSIENIADAVADLTATSTLPLVAELDNRLVAGIRLTLVGNRTALIHGYWTDPDYTPTTLPLRMMAAILREAQKLGCDQVDMSPDLKVLSLVAMLIDSGVLGDSPSNQACKNPGGWPSNDADMDCSAVQTSVVAGS